MKHQNRKNSFAGRINFTNIHLTPSTVFLVLFMLIGIFARLCQFGYMPGDINQDEAFSGYEAYSLLHYGIDSAGYRFPVYLTTWGSGMSALNTYLIIPFMALFGPKIWVIRLPQVIVACLSLWVVYLITKRILNQTAALCALFLLAIAPWHITMARWGLDANLAPGFLIFGLYFFLRGIDNSRFFMLSALMYGLTLYCYATIWPIVPLILLLQLIAGVLAKKIRFDRWLLLSGIILGLLALPLLLFLLINMNYMEEIRLPFLSIPKLLYMRANEVSLANLEPNARRLWYIIKNQYDDLLYNATYKYGLFYRGTLPFFVLGLFYCIKSTVERLLKKDLALEFFLLIQLCGGGLLGLLIYTNINRINILFIPFIMVAAIGIYYLCSLIDLRYLVLPALFYLIMFIGFERYYFTEYSEMMDFYFCRGLEDAVTEAVSYQGPIYFSRNQSHSRILFFTLSPVPEYIDTVEYFNYPAAFLEVKSFGRYSFDFNQFTPDVNATYCLSQDTDLSTFESMGFTLHYYGNYTVAHHPNNVYDNQ